MLVSISKLSLHCFRVAGEDDPCAAIGQIRNFITTGSCAASTINYTQIAVREARYTYFPLSSKFLEMRHAKHFFLRLVFSLRSGEEPKARTNRKKALGRAASPVNWTI